MEILGERGHYQIAISYRIYFFPVIYRIFKRKTFAPGPYWSSVWAVLVDMMQNTRGDFWFQVWAYDVREIEEKSHAICPLSRFLVCLNLNFLLCPEDGLGVSWPPFMAFFPMKPHWGHLSLPHCCSFSILGAYWGHMGKLNLLGLPGPWLSP